jgi:ATPase subunit of ABC transporter with duplicated ATPase domains
MEVTVSLLSAHHISYSHSGGVPLFSGLSFEIDPGDRIGLVGLNGCGKTTLLRLIAGECSPAAGRNRGAARAAHGFLASGAERDGRR